MSPATCDMTSSDADIRHLFGGTVPWDESLWTATDDRVRGGSSISHLNVHQPSSEASGFARFYGNLDTSTLGGAGFASQRTKGELDLNLSDYIGLRVSVRKSDGKKYLLTLKDEIPGRRDDGREMSGITWEADFTASGCKESEKTEEVFLPWNAFKATYRGRPQDEVKPLNIKSIKRVSFMMRSFFDQQKGDFSLDIVSVAAIRENRSAFGPDTQGVGDQCDDGEWDPAREKADAVTRQSSSSRRRWRRMFCGLL